MKITVFWNITPCSLVNTCMYRWFRSLLPLKKKTVTFIFVTALTINLTDIINYVYRAKLFGVLLR